MDLPGVELPVWKNWISKMKILKIGRAPDNDLIIKDDKISSRHCRFRLTDNGDLLIEDLDSTNGTFVNGKAIRQKLVTAEDELLLASFRFDISLALKFFEYSEPPQGITLTEFINREKVIEEFANLRQVYDKYIKAKMKIIKTSSLASTGLRAGLSLVPVVGSALGTLSTAVTGNTQEKMMQLEEQYKKDYICPACYRFLGEPFDNLQKRGYCMGCKAQWIKH